MSKIVFQKGNGLKKDLENFWWQKKKNPENRNKQTKKPPLIVFPSPNNSARSLVSVKQIRLTVKQLCLAFGNGSW